MAEEHSVLPESPPVVFLGLCGRATHVRERITNLFKWNILGLKTVILSYIYPLRIDHLAIGPPFPSTIAAEEAKFRIISVAGGVRHLAASGVAGFVLTSAFMSKAKLA